MASKLAAQTAMFGQQKGGVIIEAALSMALILIVLSGVLSATSSMSRYQAFVATVEPVVREYANDYGRISPLNRMTRSPLKAQLQDALVSKGIINSNSISSVTVTRTLSSYRTLSNGPSPCSPNLPCLVTIVINAAVTNGFWQQMAGSRPVSLSFPAIYRELDQAPLTP